MPCPVMFDPDDINETLCLEAEMREVDKTLEGCHCDWPWTRGLGAR